MRELIEDVGNDTAIANEKVTGSGSIPEPVHGELEDKLDAAFSSAEPDWWLFLEPAQPNEGDV
jgi:hypothetical protein